MVGDRTDAREIVIGRRNNNLQFIADTHRSCDALQYPLMFWKGQDGYYINIKQRDHVSGNSFRTYSAFSVQQFYELNYYSFNKTIQLLNGISFKFILYYYRSRNKQERELEELLCVSTDD